MPGDYGMTKGALRAAALAAGVFAATGAWAKAPAPLIPVALVEDISSNNSNNSSTDVEFMDYVGGGQVIKLAPRDVLVLSYLKSCAHETITGGTVRIGIERSEVEGGKVVRTKVACDGGKMQLASAQANASGASAFRLQSATIHPTLRAMPPVIEVPKLVQGDGRTLVIERKDRPSERLEVAIGDDLAGGGFYDLGKTDQKLAKGAIYTATLGPHYKVVFKIHAKAKDANKSATKSGKPPVISRLLRFPPG